MTTLSVVDVESIVGEMPAQVCELHDVQMNPLCDSQAEWLARVHLANPIEITCKIAVMAFCDNHLHEVQEIINNDPLPFCFVCGMDSHTEFHAVRL
ncbi:hypothetical protein [Mycobacteroides abscessus]|uniref:hypothetical protein n=1 Tax=Mycobacteroides abscessus TaxID=36809 RepID=UPI0009284FD1|nr:hypothetical protein [Mycobacteroides abscessus]SIG00714.1 Uncharacterised protein [Mycobacteroides abscessus subsp. abscessus]SKW94465.1 Uncharacterised protein [Mycobacteroides abscessus subsp. abscessus]SKX63582.1 Uncharacterised protein [Mycobacteroides abscessus subsp. abscessus]SKZ15775.1 Uncharacterised protein [Mycobacteroides abscessus subsp. abscessus]SKZ31945.1 Uncharacterised protein [Mycobacteroides abscessus subsp. abscessus]